MSVYESKRSDSGLKFLHNAVGIRVEINKFLVTKQVPKSWRFLVAVPMAEAARSVVYNLNRAEAFFPNSTFNVLERKRYYNLAIADCEQLHQDLQCLIEMGNQVNVNHVEGLVGKVDEEIKLIKGVRNATRVRGGQSKEQIVAAAAAELERAHRL